MTQHSWFKSRDALDKLYLTAKFALYAFEILCLLNFAIILKQVLRQITLGASPHSHDVIQIL